MTNSKTENSEENLPAISVIVSNFNGAAYLPKLLLTLKSQRGVITEIIIVDRCSQDESPAILSAHPDVQVLSEPPESGLVTGYSVGAEKATHPLLFFCNEDMWFDPDCLRRLADNIDPGKRIGAADPWQWTYDGSKWIHGGTRFVPCRLDLNSPFPMRRYDFNVSLRSGDVVPFGCAGAIMISRRVYDEVGGWDRGFFLDHEDVDLFIRAWQAGWKCVTVPDARVYHAVNVSNSKSISGGRLRVSLRRYVSGRSSILILGLKYFAAPQFCMLVFIWLALLLKHLVTLRLVQARGCFLAMREFIARWPDAIRYRRAHSELNRKKPGRSFFLASEFQLTGGGGDASQLERRESNHSM